MPSPIITREKAEPLVMWGGPLSSAAEGLVQHLLEAIILPAAERVDEHGVFRKVRPSSSNKLRIATGALLADLFDFHRGAKGGSRPRRCYRGMSKSNFSKDDLGFGHGIFKDATGPLIECGLLTSTTGSVFWTKRDGSFKVVSVSKTCFGLTEAMVNLGAEHGVAPSDWGSHWTRFTEGRAHPTSTAPRLVLRKERRREGHRKTDAQDHPFDATHPAPQVILRDTERLNEYLRSQRISGLAFAGLRRIFSNGNTDGTAWNKGGRYYSLPGGHRYEAWGADRRCESIRLNGEEVVEVDLRASHLTLLHGLLMMPFDADDDPYAIDDWPRPVVKEWVAQALGASNPRPFQWSDDAEDSYEDERPGRWMGGEFPIREVGASIVRRHPAFVDLKTCGLDTLDLQYHEAEILRSAMETLMLEGDIPVLPIHDALIVPRSQAEAAIEVLKGAFVNHVEGVTGHPSLATPKVTLKGER